MTTTTEASTKGRVVWAPTPTACAAWLLPVRTFGADAARIMAAFVDRAEALPGEAERILRDGMDYAAQFCAGATVEDEAALIRAAGRYLDRNYPVAPCSRCGGLNGSHGLVHVSHDNGAGHNEPCPERAA